MVTTPRADVAHVVQLFVSGDVAGTDQLDAGLLQPEIAECLHQRGGVLATGNEGNTASGPASLARCMNGT